MGQPGLGMGQSDQVMWKLAPLIILIFGMITLASACGGGGQETVHTPTATSKIAFTSGRDGNDEIYVMNADGSAQTNLSNNPAQDDSAAWSPDGSRIAFASNRDGNWDVYVMNADGSSRTRLTDNPAWDRNPAWSPGP